MVIVHTARVLAMIKIRRVHRGISSAGSWCDNRGKYGLRSRIESNRKSKTADMISCTSSTSSTSICRQHHPCRCRRFGNFSHRFGSKRCCYSLQLWWRAKSRPNFCSAAPVFTSIPMRSATQMLTQDSAHWRRRAACCTTRWPVMVMVMMHKHHNVLRLSSVSNHAICIYF